MEYYYQYTNLRGILKFWSQPTPKHYSTTDTTKRGFTPWGMQCYKSCIKAFALKKLHFEFKSSVQAYDITYCLYYGFSRRTRLKNKMVKLQQGKM